MAIANETYYTLVTKNEDEHKRMEEYIREHGKTSCYTIHKKGDNQEHRHWIFQIKDNIVERNHRRYFENKKFKLEGITKKEFKIKITNIEAYIRYLKYEKGEQKGECRENIRGELICDNATSRRYTIWWEQANHNNENITPKIERPKQEPIDKKKQQIDEIKIFKELITKYDVHSTASFTRLQVALEYGDIIIDENKKNIINEIYNDYQTNPIKYEKLIEALIKTEREKQNEINRRIAKKEGIEKTWEVEEERLLEKGEIIDEEIIPEIKAQLLKVYTSDYLKYNYELPSNIATKKEEFNNFAKINKAFLENKFDKLGGIALKGIASTGKSLITGLLTSGYKCGGISQSAAPDSNFRFEGLSGKQINILEEFQCKNNDDIQQLKVITNSKDTGYVGRKGKTDIELEYDRITYITSNKNIWDLVVAPDINDRDALKERILTLDMDIRIKFSKNNINKITLIRAHRLAFEEALKANTKYEKSEEDIIGLIDQIIIETNKLNISEHTIEKHNKTDNDRIYYGIKKKIDQLNSNLEQIDNLLTEIKNKIPLELKIKICNYHTLKSNIKHNPYFTKEEINLINQTDYLDV